MTRPAAEVYQDGSSYEGTWSEGTWSGFGVWTDSSGVIEAHWSGTGELDRSHKATLTSTNLGAKYHGEVPAGAREGPDPGSSHSPSAVSWLGDSGRCAPPKKLHRDAAACP